MYFYCYWPLFNWNTKQRCLKIYPNYWIWIILGIWIVNNSCKVFVTCLLSSFVFEKAVASSPLRKKICIFYAPFFTRHFRPFDKSFRKKLFRKSLLFLPEKTWYLICASDYKQSLTTMLLKIQDKVAVWPRPLHGYSYNLPLGTYFLMNYTYNYDF